MKPTAHKGVDVVIHIRTQTGTDSFGAPVYTDTTETVSGCLVNPSTVDDVIDETRLKGSKELYTIAVPKGDSHEWFDSTVEFFGKSWHVYARPMEGVEDLIPLKWHKKVLVERYE